MKFTLFILAFTRLPRSRCVSRDAHLKMVKCALFIILIPFKRTYSIDRQVLFISERNLIEIGQAIGWVAWCCVCLGIKCWSSSSNKRSQCSHLNGRLGLIYRISSVPRCLSQMNRMTKSKNETFWWWWWNMASMN